MGRNNLLPGLLFLVAAGTLPACGPGAADRPAATSETEMAPMTEKLPMKADGIVRLSKIEVYPEYLDEYLRYAVEVGETSLRVEPGVLTMYALQERERPCRITILETYASEEAYRRHIASEHFRQYKQGTLHMVKSLELCDQRPLDPRNRIDNRIVGGPQSAADSD